MSRPSDKTPSSKSIGHSLDVPDADIVALSKAYGETKDLEPAKGLDDFLKAAARRAVNAKPQSLKKTEWRRWTTPVAIAATVVLTVSVGMLSLEKKNEIRIADATPYAAPPPVAPMLKPMAPSNTDSASAAAPAGVTIAKSTVAEPASDVSANVASDKALMRAPVVATAKLRAASPHEEAALADDSPAAWLKRIEVLYEDGKRKEASKELAKFKQRYPKYPLPEKLKNES